MRCADRVNSPADLKVLVCFRTWLKPVGHSFTRHFALSRAALWQKTRTRSLLDSMGQRGWRLVSGHAQGGLFWPDSVDSYGKAGSHIRTNTQTFLNAT